jgi:methylmalonyl-CoA/ethylmalonyl-CoA epimerase
VIEGLRDLRFHHVGVACADIRVEAARLAPLGYAPEGAEFVDPAQGVRGIFLAGQSPRLELLEPLAEARHGVLTPWLRQDVKLYHLAYLATDLRSAIDRLRSDGAKLIVAPVSAVAFDGCEIAFVMLPNRLLVELIASE